MFKIKVRNMHYISHNFMMCNLFQATAMLAVKQKRRIYDITNVLEGIGLIEKKTKNQVRWRYLKYYLYNI